MEYKQIVSGTKWVAFTTSITSAIGLITTILLPRFIAPRDYGLFALGTLVMGIATKLGSFGQYQYIIYKGNNNLKAQSATFSSFFIANVCFFILQIIFADQLATFFHQKQLTEIFRLAAFGYILAAFRLVPTALLAQKMEFKKKFWPEFGNVLAYTIIGLVMAINGLGVWALVGAQLVSLFVEVAIAWKITKWRPKFTFDRADMKELFRYGIPLFLSGMGVYLFSNIDNFAIGKFLDSTQLGYYCLAFQLATLLPLKVYQIVGAVAFPAYALTRGITYEIRPLYLRVMNLSSFIGVAIVGSTFVFAEPFVTLIYGTSWYPAIRPFQILSIYGFCFMLIAVSDGVCLALGKAKAVMSVSLINLAVAAIFMPLALHYNVVGVAVLMTVACCIGTMALIVYIFRLLKFRYRDWIFPGVVSPVCGALSVLVCFTFGSHFAHNRLLTNITVEVGIFVFVYFLMALSCNRGLRLLIKETLAF